MCGECQVKKSYRVTVILLALTLAACSDANSKQDKLNNVPLVELIEVESQKYQPELQLVGRIEALEDVDLYSQAQGYLIQRHFNEGDEVKEGQLLFEIDDRIFAANLKAAKAELAEGKAELSVRGLNQQRGLGLLPQGSISQAEMDTLNAYQLNAVARVERLTAKWQQAELELSFTRIKAPFSGRISDSKVALGQLIDPSVTVLANLVSTGPVNVAFRISELERERLKLNIGSKKGQGEGRNKSKLGSRIELPSGKRCPSPGIISYLDNRIDVTTGTLKVKSTFANHKGNLLPGQYVNVVLSPPKITYPSVPLEAVQKDRGGDYLMIVGSDLVAQRRNVVLGGVLTNSVEGSFNEQANGAIWVVIKQGVIEGDKIVHKGLQHIRSGSQVRLSNPIDAQIQGEV